MNLYEAVKSNAKRYNLIHADSDKISELESSSAFTWEGLSKDDDSLSQVVDFFTKESKGFKVPCDIYWWSGKEFNDKYELTGSNKYPNNLTFVSIPLDMWSEMGNLPMLKFQVGARWLDDIVDNNARREGKEDFDESEDVDDLKSKLNKLADDHFLHNMNDHWDQDDFKREDTYTKDISDVVSSLEKQGVSVYHKDFNGNEVPGYSMGYEIVFKDKMDEAERVSEIDLKRISLEDREYDLNFSDKLEELGYEYIFKYDGKVFYRRDPNHFDDDIIIIDTEHGVMTKVDHNGESLFFNDDEVSKLNQEEE